MLARAARRRFAALAVLSAVIVLCLAGPLAPLALAEGLRQPYNKPGDPIEPYSVSASAAVMVDLLRVRGGPSTAYDVVANTKLGEQWAVVGRSEDGKWWQVASRKSQGWLRAEYVKVSGSRTEIHVAKAPPLPERPAPVPVAAAPATPAQPAAAEAAPASPRPVSAGYFGYGIQIDPGDLNGSIGPVKEIGFGWVKFQLPWKDFEGAGPGQRNWPDDVVNALNGNGLQILASIVKAPAWARPGNTDMGVEGPPADPGTYASFVGEFAARYCGRVQAIEVWNEQNLHYEWGNESLDAARYVRLLAAAYRSIKAACPRTIVVSGAPTPTGANPPAAIRDTTYLEQMYRAGLRSYCDAVGVHPSGYGNTPDARFQDWQAGNYSRPSHVSDPSFFFRNTMEQYRNIMVKYGDGNKRLWPTEFGWASTGNPVGGYEYALYNSEGQQAEYIARAYEIMRGWGWVGVAFLWNLNYNQTQPSSEMAAFGILGRPAFERLKSMPK